jgi:hypothetical protein
MNTAASTAKEKPGLHPTPAGAPALPADLLPATPLVAMSTSSGKRLSAALTP